jgi:CHAT domain-containing protein/ankyrin repeat protein
MKTSVIIALFLLVSFYGHTQNKKIEDIKQAIFEKDKEKVCELVTKSNNVNARDTAGTPLLYYAAQSGDLDLFKCFINAGANLNIKGILWSDSTRQYYFGSLLCIAAGYSNYPLTKYLVEELNMDVNQPELSLEDTAYTGWTPLIWAALDSRAQIFRYLIDKGADVNYFAPSDSTPALLYALNNYNDTVVNLLLEKGADVTATNPSGFTPLHYTCRDGHYKTSKIIIDKGADVNAKSVQGYTPMILAAYNGNEEVIELLLENGADKTIKDAENLAAIDYAKDRKQEGVFLLLNDPDQYYKSLDWRGWNRKTTRKINDDDYPGALYCTRKAFPLAVENPGDSSYKLIIAHNNMGYLYELNFMMDSAIYHYDQQRAIVLKIHGKHSKKYLSCLNDLRDLYEKAGKFSERVKVVEESKEITGKIYGTESINYLRSLNILGLAYEEIDNYYKAEEIFLEAKKLAEKIAGKDHVDYAKVLGNLGDLYGSIGKFDLALHYDTLAIPIYRDSLGDYHYNHLNALHNLAFLYKNRAEYKKSEECYLKLKNLTELTEFKDDEFYASLMHNLGMLYYETARFRIADSMMLIALKLRKKYLGEDHPHYAYSISSYGLIKYQMGKHKEAMELFEQYLDIVIRIRGKKHKEYAVALNNLALPKKDLGQYDEAIQLMNEAIEVYRNLDPPRYTSLYIALSNQGLNYQTIGDYLNAEKCYKEGLELRKKVIGQNHPDYAAILQSFGSLYSDMGDFKKAEEFYMRSNKIYLEALGKEHPDYATSLDQIGSFYIDLGDYKKAEKYYIEAANIREKVYGKLHFNYAASLNNVALANYKMGFYNNARKLYLASMDIKAYLGRTNTHDYAISCNNLGIIYNDLNDLDSAAMMYEKSLEIDIALFGEEHPSIATTLNNLAIVYSDQQKYNKAIEVFEDALKISINTLGKTHPENKLYYNNLGHNYNFLMDGKKTWENYSKAYQILDKQISSLFSFMSEKEKEIFLKKVGYDYEVYYSMNYKYRKEIPEMGEWAYNSALTYKGMLLQSGKMLRESIQNSNDTELINLFNDFSNNKKLLSQMYSVSKESRKYDIDSLEEVVVMQEKQLARKSDQLEFIHQNIKFTADDIKERLKENEAAIEFIHFEYNDMKWTGNTMYCALVLRNDYKYPEIIKLFDSKDLEKIMGSNAKKSAPTYVSSLYGTTIKESQNMFSDSAKYKIDLYNLVWKPLEKSLDGVDKVYYSPSGLLHKIAFDAIQTPDTLYLSDKYKMNYLSSTRSLCYDRKTFKIMQDMKMYLFGGIEYDLDSITLVSTALEQRGTSDMTASRNVSFVQDSTRGAAFNFLSGTVEEVDNINLMFEEKKIKTQSNMSFLATEESFKMLSNQNEPNIAHIATHGFFSPDPQKINQTEKKNLTRMGGDNSAARAFTHAENPLFRSGLVFAGANRVWKGEKPIEGIDDGILTAYEISNLNLSNTKLVVMSACETGLGDIKGSEGVYGLQRSFKMAGVDYLVMSLWEVPDYHTSKLMQSFYDNWLKGMDICEAFNKAQSEMRKKYDPYYWAAFVLIE